METAICEIFPRIQANQACQALPLFAQYCCSLILDTSDTHPSTVLRLLLQPQFDSIGACKKLCSTSSLTGNGNVQNIFVLLSLIVANTFCPLNSRCPVKVMELPSLTFYVCSRRRYDDCHGLAVNVT